MKKEEQLNINEKEKRHQANHINQGLKDMKEGNVIDGNVFINELKQKYNI